MSAPEAPKQPRLSKEEAAALAEQLRTVIPVAMRERKQWLLWRFEPGEKKPKKMPYYIGGGRRTGEQGSDADRAKLGTFDEVLDALVKVKCSGVGFAFLPGDGLIGIDIDGQLNENLEPSERAAAIVESCASYTEFSPSRRGVHIIVAGESETFKSNDIGLEVFCGRQFFTVTGAPVAGTPPEITPISAHVLSRLRATVRQAKETPKAAASPAPSSAPEGDKRGELESALTVLPADCGYEEWIEVGMALQAELGDAGFGVWDYWSSRASKYPGPDELRKHWKSFAPKAGGVTGATIFKRARTAGWRPPRRPGSGPKSRLPQQAAPAGQAEPPAEIASPPPEESRQLTWDDKRWRRNSEGGLRNSPANVDLILRHDQRWAGVLAYDEFSYRIMKLRPPPFDGGCEGPWEETDATKTAIWIERAWGLPTKSHIVDEVARSVAWDARYHCVRAWLKSRQPWDGIERLPTLMADVFGAEQSEYTSHIGIGLLVTAVARAFRPGCKVDTMVVLEGEQGIGKSTALIELFSAGWYVDIIEPPSHKDFYITLQGAWCCEIGEMQSFTRSEVNQVKQAISRRNDKFRSPYDKAASDHPRQGTFVGTTNADAYLMDPTGGRRFLPVKCTRADVAYVREWREQLFAEAMVRLKKGFKWWAFPQEQAASEQDHRYVEDSWVEPVEAWLNGQINVYPETVELSLDASGKVLRPSSATTTQVMQHALRIELAKHTRQDQMRVAQIMRRLGWVQAKLQRVAGDSHSRIRPWIRPPEAVSASPDSEDVPI